MELTGGVNPPVKHRCICVMRFRDAILIGLGALMSLLIVVFAARIVGHYQSEIPGGRIELGRVKMTQLAPETEQLLANLRHDVLITYYVSGREHMPSDMVRIEREVTDLLETMRRASNGRLDFQIVDPQVDEQFTRHAAHQRVAPFRVRSIARDSYSERTVWSTLHIAYGPHEPAVINGVSTAHLPLLQSLIVGQLRQKDQPVRPVYGLAGPSPYRLLEQWLGRTGEVVRVDLDGGEAIPEHVDVLFWLDPVRADAEAVRTVQRFLDSGRSAIIAGSRHEVIQQRQQPLELRQTGYDPEFLLASFGLRPVDGMVLDAMSEHMPGDAAPVPARFLVRCIPPNQDFRELRELPNGHFLFAAPTPLTLDREVLAERGLTPTVLATTSDRTQLADMVYGEVNLASAVYHQGDSVPKLPLMVWLRPHETWKGSLVVSASSSPFRDGAFEAEGFAHRRLVDVLTQTLGSDERLVIHRAGLHRAEPLPPLTATSRIMWRIMCIAVIPALIALIAWKRGAFSLRSDAHHARRTPLRGLALVALCLALIAIIVAYVPTWRIDLTADRTNRLARASQVIASETVNEHEVKLTLIMSRPENMPPEMRPMLRRLPATLAEFRRAGAVIDVQRLYPEDLDAPRRDALAAEGVQPVRFTTRDEDLTVVRTVYSAIKLEGNGRTELLHFPNRLSFEHLEFRLAFALWRLQTGRQPHIAFASDVPRLSAAEAYHDFQQRSLLAPSGTDVYSLAREALERADFRVTHLNPRSPHVPQDIDLIIWMQPRRDILPMLDLVVDQLSRGVPVMIAAQQFNMQARQYRGAEFQTVYWPQPQVVDLHLHYLPDIGVELVHEVLFDELHGRMELQTQINRATGERDYEAQASALPFLIRASAANFNSNHPIMRNLGDQLLPFAAYWRLDEDRLAELNITATPLLTTSSRTWTYDWTGGWIPDDLLAGPGLDDDDQPQWRERLPLGVLLEGAFPLPVEPLTARRVNADHPVDLRANAGEPSRLLLLSCSEMFKNHRLHDGEYRSDHLLLNAVANLALDESLASIATHRRVARGFDYVDAVTRLRWRAIVLATGPIVMLLLSFTWFTMRSLPERRGGAR